MCRRLTTPTGHVSVDCLHLDFIFRLSKKWFSLNLLNHMLSFISEIELGTPFNVTGKSTGLRRALLDVLRITYGMDLSYVSPSKRSLLLQLKNRTLKVSVLMALQIMVHNINT